MAWRPICISRVTTTGWPRSCQKTLAQEPKFALAAEWLGMAEVQLQEKSWELVFLRVEPWLDSLRDDPRHGRLVLKPTIRTR